jgi:integrase/recombinase XerC
MKAHNADNERIKRRYFHYLAEAQGFSASTVGSVAKAINRFELYTGFRDFKAFHVEQVRSFKADLSKQASMRTCERLAAATLYSTLSALRRFFIWLAGQPGYKSRLSFSDAEYFNPTTRESAIATARREKQAPSLDQIRRTVQTMPATTEIERRDRALLAFTILTGMRDSAIASIKLKHVDAGAGRIDQDARQVKTKFSKSFTTWFFPVGNEFVEIFTDWVAYLRQNKRYGPEDPLFPATKISFSANQQFEAAGLDRKHWSGAGSIRKIFKTAFANAELPYFNPHSFRATLVQIGEKRCRTPEQFKAWSQNLGHEKVLTTFSAYGAVAAARQREIIHGLAEQPDDGLEFEELAKKIVEVAKRARA